MGIKNNEKQNGIQFYWRAGNYALEACPKELSSVIHDVQNETIDFVKYYRQEGKEYKYSIGFFWWNDHEPCWELKFVGDRFTEVGEEEITEIWHMLKSAYYALSQWKEREQNDV